MEALALNLDEHPVKELLSLYRYEGVVVGPGHYYYILPANVCRRKIRNILFRG